MSIGMVRSLREISNDLGPTCTLSPPLTVQVGHLLIKQELPQTNVDDQQEEFAPLIAP